MAKQKVAREITVLVRYIVKATGNVVLYVQNDKGDKYYVTLQSNGATSCNCVATRKCYHIARCTELEAARKEVASQFSAKHAPSWLVELVNKGVVVAPKVVHTVAQEIVSPKVTDISTKGNLNRNNGFSLLKQAV